MPPLGQSSQCNFPIKLHFSMILELYVKKAMQMQIYFIKKFSYFTDRLISIYVIWKNDVAIRQAKKYLYKNAQWAKMRKKSILARQCSGFLNVFLKKFRVEGSRRRSGVKNFSKKYVDFSLWLGAFGWFQDYLKD